MRKLIIILMALIAYSTQALADKVSFTATAPDAVVVVDQIRLSYTVSTQKVKDFLRANEQFQCITRVRLGGRHWLA